MRYSSKTKATLNQSKRIAKPITRSLDRCDKELAAIHVLNKSLRTLRDQPEKKVEFQWKMQLRRRLLNRLARRLNRLAHIKDGEIVAPPRLPLYGDTPFTLNEKDFEVFKASTKEKEPVEGEDSDTKEQPADVEYDVGYSDMNSSSGGKEEDLEEKVIGKGGVGISTQHLSPMARAQRGMSDREKITEYKRWRAELLQKIPDQCTFTDIKPDFCAQIAKFLEEKADKKLAEEKEKSRSEKEEGRNGDSGEEGAAPLSKSKPEPNESTVTRPFSLKPLPSFFDQDKERLLAIQKDVLETESREHIQKKGNNAVNEYNACLRKSNELANHQMRIRSDLQKILHWSQSQTNKQNTQRQYSMELQVAKQRYKVYRNNVEMQQITKRKQMESLAENETKKQNLGSFVQLSVGATLMSIVDTIEVRYGQGHTNGQQPKLGATLMSAVNGVMQTVTRNRTHPDTPYLVFNAKNLEPYAIQKFVPPPVPRGMNQPDDTNRAQIAQLEQRARQEYARYNQMVQQSESDRIKAWQRYLKVKAELESTEMRQRHVLSQPFPQMKSQLLPLFDHQYLSRMKRNSTKQKSSQLSLDKYPRIELSAKIYKDGSVLPFEPARKGDDGLYLRPTGKQRKDMDWDPKIGRWIPLDCLVHH